MKNLIKNNDGITLVALIITIILLLILAGITISQLAGNGIFEKVKKAKIIYENKQEEENEMIGQYENEVAKFLGNRNLTDDLTNEFVIGSIVASGTTGTNYAAQGHSSNEDYFTVEGGTEKNYLIVNALKKMHILVVLQSAGRGNDVTRKIQINNVDVYSKSFGITAAKGFDTYEQDVNAGDVVKIIATRDASVKSVAINVFCTKEL